MFNRRQYQLSTDYDVKCANYKAVGTVIKVTLVYQHSQVNMMEQNQHQQRHAADQEFHASLHQLEDILQENPTEDEVATQLQTSSTSNDPLDEILTLADLEEAVADIEQYLAEHRQ